MRAFWDLSTERQIGMGVGPIPWSIRRFYAEHAGLEECMIDPFIEIIGKMDIVFMDWLTAEQEKKTPKAPKRTPH